MNSLKSYALCAAVLIGLAACGSSDHGGTSASGGSGSGASASTGLSLSQTDRQFVISDGTTTLTLDRNDWHARWSMTGTTLFEDAAAAAAGAQTQLTNPDYVRFNNLLNGINQAYPGLPQVTYQPLAYLNGAQWHYATGVGAVQVAGNVATASLTTDDGLGATLTFTYAADGSVKLHYVPAAANVTAVSTAWASPDGQAWFGGGQRFSSTNLRGTALPLWISHGPDSNRQTSTNEIAASFFWSPSGSGAAIDSDARGEIVFAKSDERTDAVRATIENNALDIVYYRGTPAQILSAYTARVGRPQWTPPSWMWRPMVWQDGDTSTDSVNQLVDGMQSRNIPLGAVWLDNPWDAGQGSFNFDPTRFADPDGMIQQLHAKNIRLMVWLSSYYNGTFATDAQAKGWTITGTRPDNNDATYYPPRGLDIHVDFTNPDAYAAWRDGLRGLIRRGVDGVKVDRGEEDLSDTSVWHNGLPNRLNHNAYIDAYHHAIFDAFNAERPNGDFVILARGGWNGSMRWAGHWEADNQSEPGDDGLTQALRGLESQAMSGFSFTGGDIGGYAGGRQNTGAAGESNPLLTPTEGTYIRWTELGALSPVMQTPVAPWWVSENAVAVYRRYATLHDRLVPYIAAAAQQNINDGTPIVRPLPFAYPNDASAVAADDEYLFGPDLLVAPATSVLTTLGIGTRQVYLPAGTWHDFWTGQTLAGPQTLTIVPDMDKIPLYVRDGATLPAGVSAAELP
ncbi:MAG TPA: TIM-barrel domain-containing protein [Paraburkholderia sp.]|nr:TIM-barrel domain-containing protein [Paraburkholderia sp.]